MYGIFHLHLVDFYGNLVGKYTSSMDPMGTHHNKFTTAGIAFDHHPALHTSVVRLARIRNHKSSLQVIHSLKLTYLLKRWYPKRKLVFQPSIFGCKPLVSGRVKYYLLHPAGAPKAQIDRFFTRHSQE